MNEWTMKNDSWEFFINEDSLYGCSFCKIDLNSDFSLELHDILRTT